MMAVLDGRVDAIVLTGGLSYSTRFTGSIKQRVGSMAKVLTYPGEDELAALAEGTLRVLRGAERALTTNSTKTGYGMISLIKNRVHELYYGQDVNCARTTLICLSELFDTPIERQTMNAAIGLHGRAGIDAVRAGEGALMFWESIFSGRSKSTEEIVSLCYRYADEFTKRFGSLNLPRAAAGRFHEDDPRTPARG
jgi:hypothetical protein